MYAVVEINGFQFRIEKGETLKVPKFDLEAGSKITLSDVLFLTDGDRIEVGTPFVDGAEVEQPWSDRARTGNRGLQEEETQRLFVRRGHRQDYTRSSWTTSVFPGEREPIMHRGINGRFLPDSLLPSGE